MNVSPSNSIGHSYLQSRSNIYNGGLIADMLSHFTTTIISYKSIVYQNANSRILNYIKQFFFQNSVQMPNFRNSTPSYSLAPVSNLTTTVFGIIYLLVTLVCSLCLCFVWICYRVNRYHPDYQRHIRKFHKYTKKSKIMKMAEFQFLSNIQIKKKRKNLYKNILVNCILCCIVFVLFLVAFIFVATSQHTLKTQMMGGQNQSLLSSWRRSSKYISRFLDGLIIDSYQIFNKSLDTITISIKDLLFGSLNDLIEQLLVKFGVNNIFTNATKLIQNLEETSKSMSYIRDNSAKLSRDINIHMGSMDAHVDGLKNSIREVCDQLTQKKECLQYLAQSTYLKIPINTSLINDRSSINLDFILTQFKLNLTELAVNVLITERNLKTNIYSQTRQKVEQIDIAQSIQRIRQMWSYVSNIVSAWKPTINDVTSSISSYIVTFGDIFFIIITVLMILVTFLVFFYILLSIRSTLLYYYERQIISDLMVLPKSSPVSVLRNHNKKRRVHKLRYRYRLRNLVFYFYILSMSLVIIILLILSLTIVNISHVLSNEVCIQIWRPEGRSVTDRIVDSYLTNSWCYIVSLIVPQDVLSVLKFPQPRNIFNGILNGCQNSTGLLYALKMTEIVNVSYFMGNPETVKYLNDGLNLTYETIVRTDVKTLIPPDMTSFMESGKIISKYFDSINYQPTIDELSKNLIVLKDYPEWLRTSLMYFRTMNSYPANNTIRILEMINSTVPYLQGLERNIANLRTHFQIIQDKRNNSLYIDGLLNSLSMVQSWMVDSPSSYEEVKNVYTQKMLIEFPIKSIFTLNNVVDDVTRRLLPCVYLSLALNGLIGNLCSSDSTLDTLCSYGLNMAVMCAVMIVMLHVLWRVIRMELKEGDDENISKC